MRLSFFALLLASSFSLAAVGCASEEESETSASSVSSSLTFRATADEQYRNLGVLHAVTEVANADGLIINVVEEMTDVRNANRLRTTVVINGTVYPLPFMLNELTKVEGGAGRLTLSGTSARPDNTLSPFTVELTYDVAAGALVAPPVLAAFGEQGPLDAAGPEDRVYSRLIAVDHAAAAEVEARVVTALAVNTPDTNDYADAWKRGRRILLRLDEPAAVGTDPDALRPGRTYDLSMLFWAIDAVELEASGDLRVEGQEYVAETPGSMDLVKKPVSYRIDLHRAADGAFVDAVSAARIP